MPAAKTPTETTFSPNDTCTRSRDLPLSHLYQSKLKPFAKTGPGEKLPGRFFSIGGYEQGETAETGEVASGSWGNGKGRSRPAAPPGEWGKITGCPRRCRRRPAAGQRCRPWGPSGDEDIGLHPGRDHHGTGPLRARRSPPPTGAPQAVRSKRAVGASAPTGGRGKFLRLPGEPARGGAFAARGRKKAPAEDSTS